jgi:hypothetical protein
MAISGSMAMLMGSIVSITERRKAVRKEGGQYGRKEGNKEGKKAIRKAGRREGEKESGKKQRNGKEE